MLKLFLQNALNQEVIRNRTFLNNSFDGIIILDSAGKVIEANQSFATMLGYGLEEISNLSIYDIDAKWTRQELQKGTQEFNNKKSVIFETLHRRKDGSILNVEVSANSVELANDIVQFCVCRDITQRKLSENRLRQQEQEIRTLIETAPDIIARFNQRLERTYINPAIEAVTGIPTENFIGKCSAELALPPYLKLSIENIFRTGNQEIVEFEFSGINGKQYFQSRLIPEFDADGNVVSVMEISRDFTQQKLAEKALLHKVQQEQLLNQLLQTIRSSLDLNIVFNSATQAIANLLDLEQVAIAKYIPEQKIWKYIATFQNSPEVYDRTGLEIFDEGNPFAAKLKRLEIVQVNDTSTIIDEINLAIVQSEMVQRKSGARLIAPIIIDNQAWGSISLRKIHKVVCWEKYEVELTQTIANQLAIAIQQVTLYEQLQIELAKHKETEVKLQQSKELAEAANKAKSEFLANMSHEIRTPMNGVLGMAQLLTTTSLSDEQKGFVQTILDSGDALLTIINDILDFSKIESGNLDLEQKEFNIIDTVNSVCNLLSKEAFDKNIKLQCQINHDLPKIVIGDSSRFRQILINLMGNAIKFTKVGSIEMIISGKWIMANPAQPTYEFKFAIADTGIGIDNEQIHKLFHPFTQADASINRKFGGTGLGLAICKRLVELMQGKIWMESHGVVGGNPPSDWIREGSKNKSKGSLQGSTFHFAIALPLGKQEQIKQQIDTLSQLKASKETTPLKILLVEDNAFNQKVALLMLKKLGYQADVADNGREAVDQLFANLNSENAYDLVFMDVQMPIMDGRTATKIIREHVSSTTKPWIVALTADALPEDRDACLDSGMNDYISKPVNIQEIMRSISDFQLAR